MAVRPWLLAAALVACAGVGAAPAAGQPGPPTAFPLAPDPPDFPAAEVGPPPVVFAGKPRYAMGEAVRVCWGASGPASVIVTKQAPGEREIILLARQLHLRENQGCFATRAGVSELRCTYDAVGVETTPCYVGEPGVECVQVTTLTRLEDSSGGQENTVLIQRARDCYEVG